MVGDNRQAAYVYLLNLAEQQGYVTFDNIIDAADRWLLPIDDVDWLSNSITSRGVLVYDGAPSKTNRVNADDEYSDYAQSDYEAIFQRVIELEPSLKPLIDDIKAIRPPQFRELSGIIYQAKEGNEYARNRIAEMHLRIAVRVGLQRAEQYDTDIVDCIGDAFVGLLTAIDKYDPDTCGAFGSYANMWMLQTISRQQPTKRPLVYYPVHKKEVYFSVYPLIKEKLGVKEIDYSDIDELREWIVDNTSISKENAKDVMNAIIPVESLEEVYFDKVNEDDDDISVPNVFLVNGEIDSEIERKMLNEEIAELLNSLTDREKKVMELRYGLKGDKALTLEEVGSIFNVTRERIRQIEAKAIKKLRHPSRIKKLVDFLELTPSTTIKLLNEK